MYSRRRLSEDFRRLGVQPGDTVLLHASVRAVGEVAGGPNEIHLALGDALTADGTLMMYASCPRYFDEVGRGNLSPEEEAEILDVLPAFDPETARSARDNGALVELFRTYPGARVNRHVARFKVPVVENGVRVWREMEEFDTSGAGVHPNWPEHFFAELTDDYLAAAGNTGRPVGNADSYLFSARGLLDFALPRMIAKAAGE